MAGVLVMSGCSTERQGSAAGAGAALDQVRQRASGIALTDFYMRALWQDGKAEVARYRATRERYGTSREFVQTLITVKEEFNPGALVKSDDPDRSDTIPVIKTHTVFTLPTEHYDYQFASSVFFRRDEPAALVKATMTSHEWCGITSKALDLSGSEPIWAHRSYFEAEADGAEALSWPVGGVLEEQLFGMVRAIPFREGWSAPVALLSRQLTSHADGATWRPGELKVVGARQALDARGVAHPVWQVEFRGERGDTLSYDVSRDERHLVIAHEAPGGVTMRLEESARWAYWDRALPSPFEVEQELLQEDDASGP